VAVENEFAGVIGKVLLPAILSPIIAGLIAWTGDAGETGRLRSCG
jgi:hypothetical protein